MSMQKLMRTVLWTELRKALREDYPELEVPINAPPALKEFITHNADYISELSEGSKLP